MTPVLEHPVEHLLQRLGEGSARTMIALAGLPGSGKSTLAARLALEVNARAGSGAMVALGMDGFHLSKAALKQMADPQAALARRGAPWTFDAPALAARLQAVRAGWQRGPVAWPGFEHESGDPVEGAFAVEPQARLVLVEGLYLLGSEDAWAPVSAAFDERWFLDTPLEVALGRLALRHMSSWGLSRGQALARIEANDRLNAGIVAQSQAHADWLLQG